MVDRPPAAALTLQLAQLQRSEVNQQEIEHTFDGNQARIPILFLWHGDIDVEFVADFRDDFALLANNLRVVLFGNFNLQSHRSSSISEPTTKLPIKSRTASNLGQLPTVAVGSTRLRREIRPDASTITQHYTTRSSR